MEVRLARVPGVSNLTDLLTLLDLLTDPNGRRVHLHVCVCGKDAVADIENDHVPGELVKRNIRGKCAWWAVWLIRRHTHHNAVGDRDNRFAERQVTLVLRRVALDGGERLCRGIIADPVDREPLAAIETPANRQDNVAVQVEGAAAVVRRPAVAG